MSRSTITILFGGALGLAVGIIAAAALLFGGSFFNSRTTSEPTPIIVELETPTNIGGGSPTVTATAETVTPAATAESSATAVPTTSSQPVGTTVTPIAVSNTAVQYVQAQTNVNIRSGPGTGYEIVGWIADGQTAKVTGANEPTGWWRVICPDDTVGSCWVTGNTQYTLPTSGPFVIPTPSPAPTDCTDKAALVADITVPDNSEYGPTIGFNKVWRIKNTGTCTWNNSYKVIHVGGALMGAITSAFPLNQVVAPGNTIDLSVSMVSPAAPGSYKSDWKLQNSAGRPFGLGSNNNPFYVKIIVIDPARPSTIAGLVYQDWNENGLFDTGDTIMANRQVVLIPGTACHVVQNPVAVTYSGVDGGYSFKGQYNGSYCVGLKAEDGLEDVQSVYILPGQIMTGINLRAFAPLSSISGYVWNDYCSLAGSSSVFEGNCVSDGNGGFRADGMIQPTEVNIPGITVLIQWGSCLNNNAVPVSAVTDGNGRYTFGGLNAGTYCVSINAQAPGNIERLLPGQWTFPQPDVWYQEVTLVPGANAFPVNFGWDYQLD